MNRAHLSPNFSRQRASTPTNESSDETFVFPPEPPFFRLRAGARFIGPSDEANVAPLTNQCTEDPKQEQHCSIWIPMFRSSRRKSVYGSGTMAPFFSARRGPAAIDLQSRWMKVIDMRQLHSGKCYTRGARILYCFSMMDFLRRIASRSYLSLY